MIGRITIAFRLLCDPQWLCVYTAIASLRFSLGLRLACGQASILTFKSLTVRVASVQRFANCISMPQLYIAITMLSLCSWPHLHDCFQTTLRSGNGCVSTQRLHHCASAWPCGQALSLSFCFAAKRSLYSFRPTYRPRCAARQYALIIAIAPRSAYVVGRISIVFKLPCYLQLLCVHSDCQ